MSTDEIATGEVTGARAEQVVLLDAEGAPAGVADKATVHDTRTPLHLAFSCYVHDGSGRVLMTRRALGKRTWPGVWSNACCGHPGPDEAVADAVHRRVGEELGMTLTSLQPVLPGFRYRAVDASGVVENEVCPVYVAAAGSEPSPLPSEVAELTWARWDDVVAAVRSAPWALSPWSVLQVRELEAAGWRPPVS